ncbi:MAG: DNA translocase FtsK, partial [Coraliomargarita sp.]
DASQETPEDHASTMEALVRTLEEFGVKVIPGEIHTGPVITRYEVKPAPGVRVEKIVNLDKNIALGLKAMSVRILAPVPGKGTVGIEVPNKIAQAVCMRDIVESRAWADANAEIPIVLGKDVTGKPMVTDLTKMPHVLIAGSTGSGKTVCINAIIASLLYHSGPEDIRFIMVDPKVVEMQMYNALPHMLIPVVTEAKKVPGALKWLIAEMERRYQIFATENVRNIAGFNAKIAKTKAEKEKAAEMEAELNAEMTPEERAAVSKMEVPRDDDAFEIPRKKLPYIVCIIDELADLMMVAPADIETGIARLAQLARAAGIHLILATQRPSVNVITGVIKANLPSRISFKVASKVDSRTILDGGGAEALIGKGDMLFIPPGTSNLVRAQGAFVSDDEINGVVDYLKEHNDPPNFAEEIQNQIDAGGDEGGGGMGGAEGGDELLGDAIDVLRSTKRASTSMLQRRLRIGYNRAARLMEELEERGIVGPENGSSPREIMVDLDAM